MKLCKGSITKPHQEIVFVEKQGECPVCFCQQKTETAEFHLHAAQKEITRLRTREEEQARAWEEHAQKVEAESKALRDQIADLRGQEQIYQPMEEADIFF